MLDRARLQLPDLANALDDEIAAGSTLETATTQLGLKLHTLDAIDRTGRDQQQEPIDAPRLTAPIMAKFFQGEVDEISLLEETDEGYFMFRVDEVEAPRPRGLEEVREDVIAAWKETQQLEKAKEQASALLERVKTGATFEDLAEELGDAASLVGGEPVKRAESGAGPGFSPETIAELFNLGEGGNSNEVFEVPGGAALLRADALIEAEQPESLDTIKQEILRDMRSDLMVQYEQSLRGRYEVQINSGAMQALAAALDPDQ